jgi:hypothetical protein
MEIRYIRDYCAHSNINEACIWSEIKVFKNGENIALGVLPTSSAPLLGGTEPITNGVLNPNEYVFTNTYAVPQYVEIDLGQIYKDSIENITVWHYYADGRIFEGIKLEVSADGATWTTIFDSAVSGTYAETIDGLSFDFEVIIAPQPFFIDFGGLSVNNIFLGSKEITNLYLGENSLMGIPSKPNVKVTTLTNSVRLDWANIKNATSWNIYRSEIKGTLGEKMPDGSFIKVNTYTDTTAIGGTTYYYTVEAKNADSNKAIKAEQVEATPYSITVFESKRVEFAGYAGWTVYGTNEVTADFGNVATLQGGDRLKIDTSERLRFELPADMLGSANTGGIIKAKIAGKTDYTIEYGIRFDSGFPWSKGGKVPGFSGGAGYTGGEGDLASSLGDGFSVRLMWREDGRIIPYVYHAGMTDKYGDTFGETLGYFTDAKEHIIKYYAVLNNGLNADGILKIYLDGVQVFDKRDLLYRRDQSLIDTAHLAIFAGGSTVDWNMAGLGYIRLGYFDWR